MKTVCNITSGNPSYMTYSPICLVGGLDDVWVEVLDSRGDGQCLDITSEPRRLVASQFCAEKICDLPRRATLHVAAIPGFLTSPSVTTNSLSSGFGRVMEREVESAFLAVQRPHIANQST